MQCIFKYNKLKTNGARRFGSGIHEFWYGGSGLKSHIGHLRLIMLQLQLSEKLLSPTGNPTGHS